MTPHDSKAVLENSAQLRAQLLACIAELDVFVARLNQVVQDNRDSDNEGNDND
jgi:hypothetical protein